MYDVIKASIRTIPDYPKKGILFRDITTLLKNPKALRMTIDTLIYRYANKEIHAIAGIEARGFIFGSILAYELDIPFIPIRKKGKLPGPVVRQSYQLEYGEDTLEVHRDSFSSGTRILLTDDLIATGGTAAAGIKLLRQLGGHVIESCFVVDLPDLGGRRHLETQLNCPCFALCQFAGH